MPEALILEFTGVTEAEYAAVNKHLASTCIPARATGPRGCSRTPAGRLWWPTTSRAPDLSRLASLPR
jgi:hypothetical protein